MGRSVATRWTLTALLFLACCGHTSRALARQASSPRLLRTVAAVADQEISEAGYGAPVSLRARVTYVDAEWRILFVRDATGGIFVELPPKASRLRAGDLVDIEGITAPGDVGSNIVHPTIRVIGAGSPDAPRRLTLAAIEAGMADSQYVVTEGIIRPGAPIWNHTSLTLVDGEVSAPIVIPGGVSAAAQTLVGARVLVRGVSAVRLGGDNRPIGYQLFVQELGAIAVENSGWRDPFTTATEPIHRIYDCSLAERFLAPHHVRGQVLWQGSDELVVGDTSATIKIHSANLAGAKLGAVVDVLGFPGLEDDSVVLRDAVVRVLKAEPVAAGQTASLSLADALRSGRDGQPAQMGGRVVSQSSSGNDHKLIVRDGTTSFDLLVSGSSTSGGAFVTLNPGATIEASGIIRRVRYRDRRRPDTIQLLVSSPSRVVIRSSSPVDWQLLTGALIFTAVLLIVLWNAQLRRTLRIKMALLRTQLEHEASLENRYRRLVERNLAAVFRWRRTGEIVDCNPAFARMLGYSCAEEVIGKSYWSFVRENSSRGIREALDSESANGIETSLTREDGRTIYVLEKITRVEDGDNTWYETTALDITEAKQDRLELQRARDAAQLEAEIDALTGLPNRRRFSLLVQQHIDAAAATGNKLGLFYLDLDGFKEINDTSGHMTGDLLLQQVAQRLRSVLRRGDELCRLGGDEFAVVLTRRESLDNSSDLAEMLLSTLRAPFRIGGQELRVSASVGMSFFPEPAPDYTSLLQQADSAMYVAKRAGRNRAAHYTSEIGRKVRERSQIAAELHGAVSRREIYLEYQPEFSWRERRVVRFEALARWKSRVLGSVAPAKFIPLAEETGLINELGSHVLGMACTEAVEWQRRTGQAIPVAVNISTAQLRSETFAETVFDTLARTGLSPHLLELEMTESIMLEDMQKCREILARCRAAGIRLALDDFGTGYSSLSYLPDLPFDRIKIARSFLEKLHRGRGGEALIRAVVSVAHTLHMSVVAEGIETEKELTLIRSLGVDEIQGYLLGRPSSEPWRLIGAKPPVGPAFQSASATEASMLNSGLTVTAI